MQESYQVSEHFRQELLAKNQKIAGLQTQLEQVRQCIWSEGLLLLSLVPAAFCWALLPHT